MGTRDGKGCLSFFRGTTKRDGLGRRDRPPGPWPAVGCPSRERRVERRLQPCGAGFRWGRHRAGSVTWSPPQRGAGAGPRHARLAGGEGRVACHTASALMAAARGSGPALPWPRGLRRGPVGRSWRLPPLEGACRPFPAPLRPRLGLALRAGPSPRDTLSSLLLVAVLTLARPPHFAGSLARAEASPGAPPHTFAARRLSVPLGECPGTDGVQSGRPWRSTQCRQGASHTGPCAPRGWRALGRPRGSGLGQGGVRGPEGGDLGLIQSALCVCGWHVLWPQPTTNQKHRDDNATLSPM